jgi:hypothetical protein
VVRAVLKRRVSAIIVRTEIFVALQVCMFIFNSYHIGFGGTEIESREPFLGIRIA